MASSSSSHLIPSGSSFKSWKYEVFLSFRGEDTRNTFVGHLYESLAQQGIHTYKDDERITKDYEDSLLKAIGESRIAVIVFSKNYADSSWCLDELAYIMEFMTTRGQIVIPVFYGVDPSDVREQKGKYGEAFGKHELENNHKVDMWKDALAAAGSLYGLVTKDYANGHEAKCIKYIVGSISKKLPLSSKVSKDLIGIETRLQDLKSKLETGSSGAVRIVGIWGIGGSGKTTLASAAYTEMSVYFEGHCFLENIREESNKHGLKMLQKNMLLSILKTEGPVESEEEGRSMIKRGLCHKKVLVVLDNVDDLKQIEGLAGSHDWFGEGSRIIITTRNEHMLTRKADSVYGVSLLSHDEAIELFHTHAYREDNPVEDYEILSEKVVSYAGGLPLVLEVLGKFLYDKDKDEWKSALTKFKDIPYPDVIERLKISYDGLDSDEKDYIASSSSHLIPRSSFKSWNYEVFLSFRGEDTRKTFVDHLYTSLAQQGIHTYTDDEALPLGESIGPSILKAIRESPIAVIVFSENYANSSWCLDELAHIMECRTTRGQIVIPVFYDVDPSDVRKQKRKYGEAFAKHELKNNHKVKLWKNALADAGSLAGWDIDRYANGHEAKCIKDIVGSISRKLYPINSKVSKDLIGIETRLQDLKSKLETGSSGAVRIVGIWGIGGGGKTTLASVAYRVMSVDFEGHCFLQNIRKESRKHGLKMLQKNMLLSILKTEVPVESEEEGRSMIKRRLCRKKVLVVLDDVDDLKQIEDLAGSHDWFGEGSRIIITTRDEHMLTRKADSVYRVGLLSHDEAIELFHTHAYREDNPVEGYEVLSEKVVSYAGGLPLVLEVLGKFLYGKDKDEWKSALTKLKDIPIPDVMEKLKISYDGLDSDEKDLFLHIACFHRKRTPIDDAMKVLDACSFNPVIGVRVLVQKSLIYESNGVFDMHDLIEDMAHHIVRGKDTNYLEKHSRVWKSLKSDDAMKVLDAVNTDKYGGKTTIQQYERFTLHLEIQDLLTKALRSSNRHLKDEVAIIKRLEGDLRKHGDYMCISIMRACEILRSKDPNIFKKRGPRSIAQAIIDSFPESEIIKGLTIHDVGFLTFRINGGWMARHIHKMLQDGIALWAPTARVKTAIVDIPTLYDAADVRSGFITNMFVRTLEYCGVQVAGRMINTKSVDQVKSYVPDKHGYELIRSNLEPGYPRTLGKEEPQLSNVHADLAALWCGIHEQKADWIIYVTPVQQRGYIEKCFTAAKEFPREDPPIMTYMGYQPFMLNESEKNDFLMEFKDHPRVTSIVEQGVWYARRYSGEDILECALRYACLRTHTYVGSTLTLNLDEMLNEEGNNFMYLLQTRYRIGSTLNNARSRDMFKSKKALVGRERDLGLHLLQFSEIIEESFRTMKPHLVCEYLWSLSKNFASYCLEVGSSERNFLLCRAAEVVMDKCFDLLGIIPAFSQNQILKEAIRRHAIRDFYISLPDVRPNLTSRFEMVSMCVEVSHPNFEKGNLFGGITLSDTYGLRSDGWCKLDKEVCGHVSYFSNNWYNSVGISNPSFLPLGNPSSCHTVPFSSAIKIGISLWVTSQKKDACYQLCACNHLLDLSKFWEGDQSIKRGTFSVEGENGVVSIFYVCLKEAVDSSFKLSYEPIDGHRPRVRGRMLAYYGGDYLNSCVGYDKELYKALVFKIEPTKLEKCDDLALEKFALAVPTNGVLVFDASLEDVDSGEIIVNGTHEFHEKDEGKDSKWIINGKTCCFTLTVDWIRGEGCS